MEKLEKTAEEGSDSRNFADKKDSNGTYQGLRLVEDNQYLGGTSIRYWM